MAKSEVINEMANNTTQRVSDETLKAVKELGRMGDTFDQVVARLVSEHYELEALKKRK